MSTRSARKKQRRKRAATERRYSVYVIRLDDVVLENRRFHAANPDYVKGKPCVYVGMTGLTPRERFRQHKDGYKANRYARDHGLSLRWKLFEKYNPMTEKEAKRREVRMVSSLRSRRV